MCLINAFASGMGCLACIHSFLGGDIGVGILNLGLCLINAGFSVCYYIKAMVD